MIFCIFFSHLRNLKPCHELGYQKFTGCPLKVNCAFESIRDNIKTSAKERQHQDLSQRKPDVTS